MERLPLARMSESNEVDGSTGSAGNGDAVDVEFDETVDEDDIALGFGNEMSPSLWDGKGEGTWPDNAVRVRGRSSW